MVRLPFVSRCFFRSVAVVFKMSAYRKGSAGKNIYRNLGGLSELQTHIRICTARLSRSNGGHPQREGANLGVFVPTWLVMSWCEAASLSADRKRGRRKGPRQKTSKGKNRRKSSKSVKIFFDNFRAAPVFRPFLGGSASLGVFNLCHFRPTQTGLCKSGWVWSSLMDSQQ